MKVAMIDPSLFTLPYDRALCSALLAKGCDVTLYGRGLRSLEALPPEGAPNPFFYGLSERIRRWAPARLFHIIKGLEHPIDMARLVRAFRRERPRVIHFQWSPLPAIDVIAVRRMRQLFGPVVLTVHDMAPFNGSPTSVVQRIGSRSVWREFDHLIVHSDASKTLLADWGFPANRISRIPHGILEVPPARTKNAQQGAPLVFLLFGRIKTYKGVDLMIEAVGRLPAHLQAQCQLLVVGDPMISVEPMIKRAEALGLAGNITWDLRYVSEADMAEVFSQADVFAFPYREIDTSGVLMACLPYGKPIIASGIGAFQKMLQDGTHGRVVPPNDPDALAVALEGLLADRTMLETYGRNVAMLGTKVPSWDAIAEQTIALYESLVSARGKTSNARPGGATPPLETEKARDFAR